MQIWRIIRMMRRIELLFFFVQMELLTKDTLYG